MIESLLFFHSYDSISGRLILRGATHIPEEIIQFSDIIRILDITGGTVAELPDFLSLLSGLSAVFLGENNFRKFPQILSQCNSLRIISFKNGPLENIPENSFPESIEWLVFTNNPNIKKIPNSIGKLKNLRKLALAGTGIDTLPNSLMQCKKLEFLRISACQFAQIPTWIYELPRLAWFCDAGNPCSIKSSILDRAAIIPENDIQIFECLNVSNISVVSRGKILSSGREVAIKVHKCTITSDGYAVDDIVASLVIGSHPNIISTIGLLSRNGDNDNIGLISNLVPSGFRKLGLPPTLESCTRDTYDTNTVFSAPILIKILTDISAACEYIHSLGISHGDLYAHNILIDAFGNAILTDFGAATFYDRSIHPEYESFDIRAFGYLITELTGHIDIADYQNDAILALIEIRDLCLFNDQPQNCKFGYVRNLLAYLN